MKQTLFFIALIFFFQNLTAQTVKQPANWPNTDWTLDGTYDSSALLANPAVDASNFSYDDDAAGNGSDDELILSPPVIDLTMQPSTVPPPSP